MIVSVDESGTIHRARPAHILVARRDLYTAAADQGGREVRSSTISKVASGIPRRRARVITLHPAAEDCRGDRGGAIRHDLEASVLATAAGEASAGKSSSPRPR